jgi:general secretion pathway protein E
MSTFNPLNQLSYDLLAIKQIPYAFAKQHHVLCAQCHASDWHIYYCKLSTTSAMHEIERFANVTIHWHFVDNANNLEKLIIQAYTNLERSAAAVADEVADNIDLSQLLQDIPAVEDLLDTRDDAPIIRMINALLTQANRDRASDVHIEPYENHSSVRLRIDGILRDILTPRRELHAALIARIKIMANLDIAEKRLPQDGRINLKIGGQLLDVRVSTLPTAHGERAVLRLLQKNNNQLNLKRLGMASHTLSCVDHLIQQPHGIVLVTGPTGSGKTTTLYAALSQLNAQSINIMTVEDPVEYDLPGISQTPVNSKIDMDFARALRAILRQDPDVIMIGEIRDLETAQIAIQASLTGHLVLATLHTNDAISALTRLVDMGVEPFLLSSSLLGVLAQRLIRTLCPHCKQQDSIGVWHAVGCPECGMTGYFGRTGIYEILKIDNTLRKLIHNFSDESEIRDHCTENNMQTMRTDGQRWIHSGLSTSEEILRATRD